MTASLVVKTTLRLVKRRMDGDRKRAVIELDEADTASVNALPPDEAVTVEVTDRSTGDRFTVSRASCGARCHCAALIHAKL